MKRFLKFCFAIFVLTCVIALSSIPIFAADGMEEYRGFIDSIPDEIENNLPDGIKSEDSEKIAGAVKEMSGVRFLLSELAGAFTSGIDSVLPSVCRVLGLIVIASVIRVTSNSFFSDSGGATLVSRLCIFGAVISGSMECIEGVGKYFHNLFSLALSYIPLSAALYSMGGNIGAAAASSSSFGLTLTVCELIFTYTVFPVFCFCLCITVCSCFDASPSLSVISGVVKKNYIFILSLIMAILCVSISAQTFISAKADNFTMRGAKFVIASFIPHFGGSVSQSLGNVASSVELLRSAVGVGGVIIILLMLIPTVVEIAVIRILYSIVSGIAGMIGCDKESAMLSEIASLYGYLLSVSAICSSVFIISFGLLAKCACAVG